MAAGATLLSAVGRARAAPMLTDVEIVRQALTQLHPGLRRYLGPRQLAEALDLFARAYAGASRPQEKFLALTRLTAAVRCGHTYPNPLNHSAAVATELFGGRTRLPFRFRWLGRRMIVTDGQASGLARGTEILRIDRIPAAQILAALLPNVRADGGNDAKRRALLGVQGRQRFETFDVYHALLFPPADDRVELAVRAPGGRAATIRLDRIDLQERRAAMRAPGSPGNWHPGWTAEHRGGATVITMADWAMYNRTWDWKAWIAAAFEEMDRRSTRALILDLRANEGGNDVGHEILARFIAQPLPVRQWERWVRYRRAPEHLVPHLDTWNRSFDRIGEQAADLADGFYRLPDETGQTIAPQGPRFRGRLIVLVGPENSSATFNFAALVRQHRLGLLVGETTGGNRRGINGSGYYFVRLPESRLEFDLPLVGMFSATPQPDAGLEPDRRIVESPADIAAGPDPVLERALALART